jgi:hypothetical protein
MKEFNLIQRYSIWKCIPLSLNIQHTQTHTLTHQYSMTNTMQILYSVYYELTACTCFRCYLLIFRRRCISNWYPVCILCQLAATRVGVQHSNPGSSQLLIHNKLNTDSASCWSYCTDILQCTVNRTLSLCIQTYIHTRTYIHTHIYIHTWIHKCVTQTTGCGINHNHTNIQKF